MTVPEDIFRVTPRSISLRDLQSKKYYDAREREVFHASIQTLQDIGFIIKKTDLKLGIVVGEKDRDATNAWEVVANIFIAAGGGQPTPMDKTQKIRASLITRIRSNNSVIVRVSFQRLVWNTANEITKMETIVDSEIYNEFFSKLNKSVFLEEEGL